MASVGVSAAHAVAPHARPPLREAARSQPSYTAALPRSSLLRGVRPTGNVNPGVVCRPSRRGRPSFARVGASAGVEGSTTELHEKDRYVEVLHRAAEDASVPRMEVFQAMMALEKMKLPADGLQQAVCAGGKRWRLVYTAGAEAVAAAIKAKGSHSELTKAGQYFPLTAVQSWNGDSSRIENGVYLGFLASLKFSGPFYMHEKKLNFDFTKLSLCLGPFKPEFNIKDETESEKEFNSIEESKGKGAKSPFFLFTYADDKIAIARGKGGGIAMWVAASPAWLMKSGVL